MPGRAAASAATPNQPTADTPPPTVPRWAYVSDDPLIYTHVPVSPKRGDVIAWPNVPAEDGRWESTDAEANRWPDNHPETLAAAERAQIAAREAAAAEATQPTEQSKEG